MLDYGLLGSKQASKQALAWRGGRERQGKCKGNAWPFTVDCGKTVEYVPRAPGVPRYMWLACGLAGCTSFPNRAVNKKNPARQHTGKEKDFHSD